MVFLRIFGGIVFCLTGGASAASTLPVAPVDNHPTPVDDVPPVDDTALRLIGFAKCESLKSQFGDTAFACAEFADALAKAVQQARAALKEIILQHGRSASSASMDERGDGRGREPEMDEDGEERDLVEPELDEDGEERDLVEPGMDEDGEERQDRRSVYSERGDFYEEEEEGEYPDRSPEELDEEVLPQQDHRTPAGARDAADGDQEREDGDFYEEEEEYQASAPSSSGDRPGRSPEELDEEVLPDEALLRPLERSLQISEAAGYPAGMPAILPGVHLAGIVIRGRTSCENNIIPLPESAEVLAADRGPVLAPAVDPAAVLGLDVFVTAFLSAEQLSVFLSHAPGCNRGWTAPPCDVCDWSAESVAALQGVGDAISVRESVCTPLRETVLHELLQLRTAIAVQRHKHGLPPPPTPNFAALLPFVKDRKREWAESSCKYYGRGLALVEAKTFPFGNSDVQCCADGRGEVALVINQIFPANGAPELGGKAVSGRLVMAALLHGLEKCPIRPPVSQSVSRSSLPFLPPGRGQGGGVVSAPATQRFTVHYVEVINSLQSFAGRKNLGLAGPLGFNTLNMVGLLNGLNAAGEGEQTEGELLSEAGNKLKGKHWEAVSCDSKFHMTCEVRLV